MSMRLEVKPLFVLCGIHHQRFPVLDHVKCLRPKGVTDSGTDVTDKDAGTNL